MPNFITRVELLYADERDYQKLDTAMRALHFYRTIQDPGTGAIHLLPENMYYSSSPETTSFVLQLAKTAARKTKRNYSVITVQSDSISFSGLEPAPVQ
ncbi:MAG TPA: hypothetical protein VGM41_20965 [Chitinophagaceae bacterium]